MHWTSPPTVSTTSTDWLTRLSDDPWSLTLAERAHAAHQLAAAQRTWLVRLPAFIEPPALNDDFPAYLLETASLAALRTAIGGSRRRRDLDTATADLLQRFVDLFRDYSVAHDPAAQRAS